MKLFLLAIIATTTLATQFDNSTCNRSGHVCGTDRRTYHDACSCMAAGHQVQYLGQCNYE